ncbi:hypothetical protein [Cupriavidus sp. PET2-C1]
MNMRKKVLIVLATALTGAAVGAGLGYGPLLRYRSEGVLKVEMSTSEYKRISELANDARTVRQFVAVSPPAGLDSYDVNHLIKDVVKGEWQKPVPRVSRGDAKELPDLILQLEQEREKGKERERERDRPAGRERAAEESRDTALVPIVYLGVRFTATTSDPNDAAKVATWFGAYFKDMATLEAVRQLVSVWTSDSRQFSDRAAERRRKYQFDIEQAQIKATALKKILTDYPDAARREASQVVDVRKDNEKFMSPMAQLVGAESEIIGLREKIQRLDREADQQTLMKDLADQAETAVAQAHRGSDSVIKVSAVIADFGKKATTDAQKEKLSSLAADISATTVRFQSQPRFIAEPSVPSLPERPRPLMVMALAALLAALLSAVFLWREVLMNALRPAGAKID